MSANAVASLVINQSNGFLTAFAWIPAERERERERATGSISTSSDHGACGCDWRGTGCFCVAASCDRGASHCDSRQIGRWQSKPKSSKVHIHIIHELSIFRELPRMKRERERKPILRLDCSFCPTIQM